MEEKEESDLSFHEFNPSKMRPDTVAIVVGKRGTGKSVLTMDILYHIHQNFDIAIAISPTEDSLIEFRKIIPNCLTFDSTDDVEPVLTKAMNMMRRLNSKGIHKRMLIIMDDTMYDKKILKGKAIRDVFMNGRHNDVMLIACMQYMMDMGPDLRTNVDYVFALREVIPSNRERLRKYLFGSFEEEEFNRAFEFYTSNNTSFVLDNTVKSADRKDYIFWYKASITNPRFIIGSRSLWKLQYMSFNPAMNDMLPDSIQDIIPGLQGKEGEGTNKNGKNKDGKNKRGKKEKVLKKFAGIKKLNKREDDDNENRNMTFHPTSDPLPQFLEVIPTTQSHFSTFKNN